MPPWIPPAEYAKIIAAIPILCVDVVLTNSAGQYLLARRTNEPLKGEFWVIGGRLEIGETGEAAARRKLREELGVTVGKLSLLGVYEDFFDTNSTGAEIPYHTVSLVFGCCVADETTFQLDAQHDGWRFAESLPQRFVVQPFDSKKISV